MNIGILKSSFKILDCNFGDDDAFYGVDVQVDTLHNQLAFPVASSSYLVVVPSYLVRSSYLVESSYLVVVRSYWVIASSFVVVTSYQLLDLKTLQSYSN